MLGRTPCRLTHTQLPLCYAPVVGSYIPPLSKVEYDHTYAKPVCQEPGTCTNIPVEIETVNSELTMVEKEQVK